MSLSSKATSDDRSSSDASSSSDEDAEDGLDASGDKEKDKNDSRASRSNDIPTLFDNIGSEVSFAATGLFWGWGCGCDPPPLLCMHCLSADAQPKTEGFHRPLQGAYGD